MDSVQNFVAPLLSNVCRFLNEFLCFWPNQAALWIAITSGSATDMRLFSSWRPVWEKVSDNILGLIFLIVAIKKKIQFNVAIVLWSSLLFISALFLSTAGYWFNFVWIMNWLWWRLLIEEQSFPHVQHSFQLPYMVKFCVIVAFVCPALVLALWLSMLMMILLKVLNLYVIW